MITIHEGDLLASNCEVICHQTNCMGAMGGGIARVIRDTYPEAYYALKQRFERGAAFVGEVDFVPTIRNGFLRCIVNCYGEYDYLPIGAVHTDYEALKVCFKKIKKEFSGRNYTIGFPYKMGCGLAGGDWNIVYKLIEDAFAGDEWRVELWHLS